MFMGSFYHLSIFVNYPKHEQSIYRYLWLSSILWLCLLTNQRIRQGILKGEVSLYCWPDWFGISCMTADNFCFLFAKQTNTNQSNTGGQWYSDTSPFSIPWIRNLFIGVYGLVRSYLKWLYSLLHFNSFKSSPFEI